MVDTRETHDDEPATEETRLSAGEAPAPATDGAQLIMAFYEEIGVDPQVAMQGEMDHGRLHELAAEERMAEWGLA